MGKTVTLSFEGSDEARAEFISVMGDFPGVKADEWVERLNAEGAGLAPYAVAVAAFATLKAALVAYLNSTKTKVVFYPNGRLKEAVNYSAKEVQKLRQLPRAMAEKKAEPEPDLKPTWGVIEGFAAKPKAGKRRKPY